GNGPGRVRDRPKAFLAWPGYWAGAGKRLNFPKLSTITIISFEGFNRTYERSFFPFGTQARVNRRNHSFRARNRKRRDQILGGTKIVADKHQVEIGRISQFAAAKFSHRDDGQIIRTGNCGGREEASFP